jgi:hypothetical protein
LRWAVLSALFIKKRRKWKLLSIMTGAQSLKL